ncbi:VP1 [Gokushovirus WZ-2015a]|nr:VP1 [Gokushovirus WZ-2015a]
MNRNVESHFSTLPKVDISRSRFDRSCSHKTSFNAGDLIPFYIDEVLPGDTFNVKTSKVVRMQSLITPVMDNVYLDTYYFYVPNRLVWQHWRELNGENTQSDWVSPVEYEVPQITAPVGGWSSGTIADYLGIPTGVSNIGVSALPFRAYALICNEWFRDQNLSDPLNVPTDDSTVVGVNSGTFVTDVAKGGLPYKAAKYHDYFTSCLPSPQKGPDVTIPVAQAGTYAVVPRSDKVPDALFDGSEISARFINYVAGSEPINSGLIYPKSTSYVPGTSVSPIQGFNFNGSQSPSSYGTGTPVFDNLWAIGTGEAQAATINQLRQAFQVQKLYERDARGGTRYIEILKSHFGVTSPDARLQRPEYLGGNRMPININQVLQQSQTTDQSAQGTPTGFSLTTDVHSDFTKSFVEHGFVIGIMVARYDHTYQQGLERFWSRKDRFDYYWPVFANIGEQAVLNKEIYAQGTAQDDEVFGYQEAWADYRYKPNRVSGEMRSNYAQSLDVWHLGDDYAVLPKLGDSWIREDASNINRVLAVSEQNSNQFFADIYVQNRTTRPMPMYSIPGLIDHH